jgi:hypothetical protein
VQGDKERSRLCTDDAHIGHVDEPQVNREFKQFLPVLGIAYTQVSAKLHRTCPVTLPERKEKRPIRDGLLHKTARMKGVVLVTSTTSLGSLIASTLAVGPD